MPDYFTNIVSQQIWQSKYRLSDALPVERSIQDTWKRVAHALSQVEFSEQDTCSEQFFSILNDFKFIPGGRILAGAGIDRNVTLFNCFVMGTINDDLESIFNALKEAALTMQQGGGIGYDFSTLRPRGTTATSSSTIASGPVSFMRIWDSMCATLLSTGARRGAMMATLRCDHPDIEEFITAKADATQLRHFNLSVLISDDFMQAVEEDADWPLVFPLSNVNERLPAYAPVIIRRWSGSDKAIPCKVIKTVAARALWEQIMRGAYDYAEPGVLFVDHINKVNNLDYCEHISATNPCGEIPLPPYGACNLGSINLTQFISKPFTADAKLDMEAICHTAEIAVQLLDNVIESSNFPLPQQQQQVSNSRRIGLGITGLANALTMLGLKYNSSEARDVATHCMQQICHTAYKTSINLAKKKGPFPLFDAQHYLQSPFIKSLPSTIRADIGKYGIRNSHLIAIAPTGTISLLANNISSGIEPVYAYQVQRRILQKDGNYCTNELQDFAWHLWKTRHENKPLPDYFVTANEISPDDHLAMQAVLQPYVDNAISKTINIPTDFSYTQFQNVYQQAYHLKLKGCTTFRPNPVTGTILSASGETESHHCCDIEREAD